MNATRVIVRLYQTVKPHQPSIKFRHGVSETSLILCACKSVDTYWKHTCLIIATHVTEYYTNFTDKSSSNSSTSATGLVHAVEIAQLPIRFHRAPMDEAEINAINSGGAE